MRNEGESLVYLPKNVYPAWWETVSEMNDMSSQSCLFIPCDVSLQPEPLELHVGLDMAVMFRSKA